jgi:hypothetical protein
MNRIELTDSEESMILQALDGAAVSAADAAAEAKKMSDPGIVRELERASQAYRDLGEKIGTAEGEVVFPSPVRIGRE